MAEAPMSRAKWSPGRQLLAFAALVIDLAGVALIVAADGRPWVILCGSGSLLVGVVLGMCALTLDLS